MRSLWYQSDFIACRPLLSVDILDDGQLPQCTLEKIAEAFVKGTYDELPPVIRLKATIRYPYTMQLFLVPIADDPTAQPSDGGDDGSAAAGQ